MTFTQEPQNIYPAYNDSYIKFTSAYAVDDRAVIIVDSNYQFTIFPNSNGEYQFNLKHVITAIMNDNRFEDNLDYSTSGWGFTDNSLYKSIDVSFTLYGDDTNENETRTYTFNKAVKQFGDKSYTNQYQLMYPSEDGINYHLTYFEGFPFEIPFRYIPAVVDNGDGTFSNEITISNKRTNETSQAFRPQNTAPYRLFIDKGSTSWNSADVLQLPDMMSQLDIKVDGAVNTTVFLTKHEARCGSYLKWFNQDGTYSYWLFNDWFKEGYDSEELDRVSTNNFSNIYDNLQGVTQITGKTGGKTIELKTSVTKEEKEYIKSLFTSPKVQLYTSREPFVDGEWLDVKVATDGMVYNSKKYRNQMKVEIELPQTQTQTL